MRVALISLAFISTILFPWQCTVLLVGISSFFIPLLPIAIGIFADTLYYTSKVSLVPLYTICGVIISGAMFLVRQRLQAGTIGK